MEDENAQSAAADEDTQNTAASDEDEEEVDNTEEESEEEDDAEEEEEEEEGDEEEGSDEEDEDDEEEDEEMEEGDSQLGISQESDSDGEDLPVCPICLDKLRNQDIGSPESCDHQFCMECIVEWSKNINTCPVDRQPFYIILARHAGQDKVFKRINVEDRQLEEEEEAPDEEQVTTCEVCELPDREDRLLLCDGCDLAYHCECLTPPLASVPVEEWFCPTCAEINRQAQESVDHVEEDALMNLPRRQIPRTRVSERVRQRIQTLRLQRRRPAELESSDEEEGKVSSEISPSTASSQKSSTPRSSTKRKKTTTRRKTKRRKTTARRTTKKRKSAASALKSTKAKGTRKKGKKRKMRRKKKTAKKKRSVPTRPNRPGFSLTSQAFSVPVSRTIKGRIAERLGLSKPPPGRTIPMQRRPGERAVNLKRGDFGTTPLSIMGDRDELIAFQDLEEEITSDEIIPAAQNAGSGLLLRQHHVIRRHPGKKSIAATHIKSSPHYMDLLSSIFMEQSMLHMNSSDIFISRDGSLKATKAVKIPNLDKPPSPIPQATRISDLMAFEVGRNGINSAEPSDNGDPGDGTTGGPDSGNSGDSGSGSGGGSDNNKSDDLNDDTRGGSDDGNGGGSDNGNSGASDVGNGGGSDAGNSGDLNISNSGGSGDGNKGESGDGNRAGSDSGDRNGLDSGNSGGSDGSKRDNSENNSRGSSSDNNGGSEGSNRIGSDKVNSGDSNKVKDSPVSDGNDSIALNTEQENADKEDGECSEGEIKSGYQSENSSPPTPPVDKKEEEEASTRNKNDLEIDTVSTDVAEKEGEISLLPSEGSTKNVSVEQDTVSLTQSGSDTQISGKKERRARRNRWTDVVKEEETEKESEELPQEVTTPFSLASFLSNISSTGLANDDRASQDPGESDERELTCINGTIACVIKKRVDMRDLDRRLDDLFEQRREEIALMRMYGIDDRKERRRDGDSNNDDSKDGRDDSKEGRDDSKDSRDHADKARSSHHRSRSRSREKDRNKRRSRSRERKTSRERRRSRSREDRFRRRDTEEDSSSSRGRERDSKDRFGRDKDKFGRDKDRFGRDRVDRDRSQDRDDKERERKRSRSPRNNRRDRETLRNQNSEEEDRFVKAGWRSSDSGQTRGGRGGWNDRGRGRDGGGGRGRGMDNRRFGGSSSHSDQYEEKGEEAIFSQSKGQARSWNQQEQSAGAGRMTASTDFYRQQSQFQQPPPPKLPPADPFQQQQQQQFGGNPPSLFSQPPPQLDPFSSVPPPPNLPPGPSSFHPWLGGGGFQQQPAISRQEPPSSQQPPPQPGMMGDYSQPPPSVPNPLKLLDNGDFDTLKKSLLMLATGSDSSTPPASGSPASGPTVLQGFRASVSQGASHMASGMGEKHQGFSEDDTSGNGESEPMDIDLPASSDKGDFQEQVIEEVKNAIRPYFSNKQITKEEYKEILKKCVPKVRNSGEINQKKISSLVGAYVKKFRGFRSK